jgi:uncharacterized protein DUF4386
MAGATSEQQRMTYARLAGFMYLFVDLAYMAGVLIIARFSVDGDVLATAQRIAASPLLYRTGLAAAMTGALCTVFLAMGLYVVLKPIDENLALLALIFRSIEATVFAVSSYASFLFLKLYVAAGQGNAAAANGLSALVKSNSIATSAAFNIAALFFSVGSILFFYLFRKTTYIPRVLSALGFYGSLLVPIVCLGSLISPRPATMLQFGWLPVGVAEVLVGFWLLFKGARAAAA